MTKELSRRTVLKGSALAALTSLFGFNVAAYAQDGDDDTQTIINLAATAELFATTHYLAGINGAEAMGLDPLQPFLDGSGEGFVGPVSPPAEDDIAAIRAEAESLGYVNSVPYAAIAAESSGSASSSSACSVTAGDQNVNIRGGAGTEFVVRGKLAPGQSAEVSGYRVGTDGQRWWQLADGGWVRADTVTTVNDCSGVAAV
jgi:hypothetical protein